MTDQLLKTKQHALQLYTLQLYKKHNIKPICNTNLNEYALKLCNNMLLD